MKRMMCMLLALALLCALLPTAALPALADEPAEQEALTIGGTRGEVIYLLWWLHGSPAPVMTEDPFVDVTPEDPYYSAVLWALENNISGGVDANHFGPDRSCTRAQVVTFLWKSEGSPKPQGTSSPFADIRDGTWYYEAVLWAYEQDWIGLAPEMTGTRVHFQPNIAATACVGTRGASGISFRFLTAENWDCAAEGHVWSAPDYAWDDAYKYCTAIHECRVCEARENESVSPALEWLQEPTLDEGGEVLLTAQFQNPAFDAQTITVKTLSYREMNPFVDVKDSDYFFFPVLWAYLSGVTGGVDKTHFGPSKPCTRAQVVTFLYTAAGMPDVQHYDCPFMDVSLDAYYATAVIWAYENGITGGIDETHFGPNKPCTRAQVMTFLYSAVGKPALQGGVQNPFVDVKQGAWYYNAVLWAYGNGVTGGVNRNHFGPGKTCTRAQVVTFLYNIPEGE